jgi:hypothetical protein
MDTIRATRSDLVNALKAATLSAANKSRTLSAQGENPDTAPQDYPQRGEPCPNGRAWCDLVLEVAVDNCNDQCVLKDEVKSRLTTNPGANKVSLVSQTSLYSPDNGDIAGYHFQWWTLLWASYKQCGFGNTNSTNVSSSYQFNPTCSGTSYDSRLTHAFTLWAEVIPTGGWVDDSARTGTALCAEAPDAYCDY